MELELSSVGLCGRKKKQQPGEKPSAQRREPTPNIFRALETQMVASSSLVGEKQYTS